MNELLETLSIDMGISRFENETDCSFNYRLCYSALGQWCLKSAKSDFFGVDGITKNHQSILLNELLSKYFELFDNLSSKFCDTNFSASDFPSHIRRVYEETGYLINDKSNRNHLANYGKQVKLSTGSLYIGIPRMPYSVCGLGVFSSSCSPNTSVNDFLIRDKLTVEEYFLSKFDICDFHDRDFDNNDMQFFDPYSEKSPSVSWSPRILTEYTVARNLISHTFYRVIVDCNDALLFSEDSIEIQDDTLTSYEYRRLLFALKAHYKNPLCARITRIDKFYSVLEIDGHLPNREYCYLLLISWPFRNSYDKTKFLVKLEFIDDVKRLLSNIGILVKEDN